MRILITGNMGYVGPGVVSQLRKTYPSAELIGFDAGYFANCLTGTDFLPEVKLSSQIIGDVRKFPERLLEGVDSVVYLAAISNDPMGKQYEQVTMDVNCTAAINIAKAAKIAGVRSFVFASSCSIYGEADDFPKEESDRLNPLTAYARSKVEAEIGLAPLADDNFIISCLRFATACGYSNRLRLDLVLNDFLAGAVISKEINILSNGTPWRPLINVLDMARAIDFAIIRDKSIGGNFLIVNTGSNSWNYQVVEIANAVAEVIKGVQVTVNHDAVPDKRSYKVNFDLYSRLAPSHQPVFDLLTTVKQLHEKMQGISFENTDFRKSGLIRLEVLNRLQSKGLLDNNLNWNWK